jgi:glycerol-3-phosphate dehydrogenase
MPDGVEIDTGEVVAFAKGMRSEAASGFSQVAARGSDLHAHGVVFGTSITASEAVSQAKARYAAALENTDANLRAYQQAAEIFADVAEAVARDFASADRSSAQAQARVDALLDNAIAKATAIIDGAGRAI